MLLLALATDYFLGFQFPTPRAECGDWENTVCSVMEKDSLEELTWMLSGGQIAFLAIWVKSRALG